MELALKNIKYNTKAISEKAFKEHLELYKGYVSKFNSITEELKNEQLNTTINSVYSKYRCLKKGETFSLDAAVLHELYFQGMTVKETRPQQKTVEVFNKFFGGFSGWAEDFISCGLASRGWAVFSFDQRTATFRNFLLDSHDEGMVCMAFPIIVLDVYEHAYFIDYGTKKENYIKQVIKSLNWDIVERQISKLL